MPNLQLSGKMVRLNGTNQNLSKYYPAPLSWNALFLRMAINQARFPGTTECVMDFLTYGGCLLRISSINERQFRWFFITTGGSRNIDETTTDAITNEWGPFHFTLVWDGMYVALYIGGRRVYIDKLCGDFSGTMPYMSVGSSYKGPTVQPFQGDIGHVILHKAIPYMYSCLPEHVYDGELTAKEWLRVHGLTESNVLILYDWRDSNGTNYGSGGPGYDLTPSNNPTFTDNKFQYELVDDVAAEA